jgi:hypothetical protein
MAQYGNYQGPIKYDYGEVTQLTSSGANTNVTITPSGLEARAGASWITCIITTTGNTRVALGVDATATSFLITSSDTLIVAIQSDRTIGVWGDGGTPTVTIKRVIT